MRNIILIIFLFVLFNCIASVQAKSVVTYYPSSQQGYYNTSRLPQNSYQYNNQYYNNLPEYSNNSFDIEALEKYTFNRIYNNEPLSMRLDRLEMQALGYVQSGNVYDRYENVRTAILNRPKGDYKRTIARRLSDYFVGQMTGFTPTMQNQYNYFQPNRYSYSNSPSNFSNSVVTESRSPFGSSNRVYNYNSGSSSGVRILD